MNPIYFGVCSWLVAMGTCCNLYARQIKKQPYDKSGQALMNAVNAIGLGCILTTAVVATVPLSSLPNLNVFMQSPFLISITTSGLAYLARKSTYFSREMNAMEQKLGKLLDMSTLIMSIATYLLLAPNASISPMAFAFNTALGAFNLLDEAGYFLSRKRDLHLINEIIGQVANEEKKIIDLK